MDWIAFLSSDNAAGITAINRNLSEKVMSEEKQVAEAAHQTKTKLKRLPLDAIRENPIALRSVNKKDEAYQGLVDSIRARGVLNPILVREVKGPDGAIHYGLVDGLQRFTASQDAGRPDIPAQVVDLSDAEVLEAQVITNVHRVETKPAEYSSQLMRILSSNPTMTITDLAGKLNKSGTWVSDRLSLNKLVPAIAGLVDEGKVVLSNAYALAKLPEDEQEAFLDRAIGMQPQEFIPTVTNRVKEIRDAKRQGREATKSEFTPVPHLQKLADIKTEFENPNIARLLVRQAGVSTAEEGFALAVRWVLHMDDNSIAEAKRKAEEREAALVAEKEKKRVAREAAKQQLAAQAAANLSE